jgi:UDP-N-acetyl-D-glucosamine dehydrogenase
MSSLKELTQKTLRSYDLIVITTSHSNVNYQFVLDNAAFVFDTKNVTRNCNKPAHLEVL